MSIKKQERLINFENIIKDIKNKPFFQDTINYKHHGGNNNIYIHCLKTAYCVYIICLLLHLNPIITKSAVIAALLHDIFGYDWSDHNCKQCKKWKYEKGINKIKKMHAFNHGIEAVENTSKYINLNENQKDAIRKHMFPLYPVPPKHIEGWLLTIADKVVATQECLYTPIYNIKHLIAA